MLILMTYWAPKKVRSLLVALAAVALVATSCGGGSADTAADAAAPAPVEQPAEQPAEQAVQSEEDTAEGSFVATTVRGAQIDFGSLEGQDVVLWFWAPW